ncbi:hypothetical protein SDC9_100784 [bioreactor metagenome]|uniref:NTP pyrophosphohydrolase MazG putative catalytic core domain-containing protein n=1 Tax=bioreactor metagenome TaxID=1076179 RepID=A0A645AL99_9ZZZZ
MSLNFYIDEVREFMDKAGFSSEVEADIFKMLDEEFALLKSSYGNEEKMQHQIYDMLFLLFEIAAKHNMDLDSEWIKGRDKKKKYLPK